MNQGSLAMLGLWEIDDIGNEEQSMNSWKQDNPSQSLDEMP